MNGERSYSAADILRLTYGRVSPADLRNWVRDGRFTVPMREPRAGHSREYSLDAVCEAATLSAMSEAGISLGMRAILDTLSYVKQWETFSERSVLIVFGRGQHGDGARFMYLSGEPGRLGIAEHIALERPIGAISIIPLGSIVARIREDIAELPAVSNCPI